MEGVTMFQWQQQKGWIARPLAVSLWIFVYWSECRAQTAPLDHSVISRAKTYEPIFEQAALKYGIDDRLLWVIAYLESRFNPMLVSRKGARGMMQFMPATAKRFGLADSHNPEASIYAAARYITYLLQRFGNRTDLVLAAYNAGEAAVAAYLAGTPIRAGGRIYNPNGIRTGGIPPFRETQSYVRQAIQLLSLRRGNERIIVEAARTDMSRQKEKRSQRIEFPSRKPETFHKRQSIYFGAQKRENN